MHTMRGQVEQIRGGLCIEIVKAGNEGTQARARDGEGLKMRLHTHTVEMVKTWE